MRQTGWTRLVVLVTGGYWDCRPEWECWLLCQSAPHWPLTSNCRPLAGNLHTSRHSRDITTTGNSPRRGKCAISTLTATSTSPPCDAIADRSARIDSTAAPEAWQLISKPANENVRRKKIGKSSPVFYFLLADLRRAAAAFSARNTKLIRQSIKPDKQYILGKSMTGGNVILFLKEMRSEEKIEKSPNWNVTKLTCLNLKSRNLRVHHLTNREMLCANKRNVPQVMHRGQTTAALSNFQWPFNKKVRMQCIYSYKSISTANHQFEFISSPNSYILLHYKPSLEGIGKKLRWAAAAAVKSKYSAKSIWFYLYWAAVWWLVRAGPAGISVSPPPPNGSPEQYTTMPAPIGNGRESRSRPRIAINKYFPETKLAATALLLIV